MVTIGHYSTSILAAPRCTQFLSFYSIPDVRVFVRVCTCVCTMCVRGSDGHKTQRETQLKPSSFSWVCNKTMYIYKVGQVPSTGFWTQKFKFNKIWHILCCVRFQWTTPRFDHLDYIQLTQLKHDLTYKNDTDISSCLRWCCSTVILTDHARVYSGQLTSVYVFILDVYVCIQMLKLHENKWMLLVLFHLSVPVII